MNINDHLKKKEMVLYNKNKIKTSNWLKCMGPASKKHLQLMETFIESMKAPADSKKGHNTLNFFFKDEWRQNVLDMNYGHYNLKKEEMEKINGEASK